MKNDELSYSINSAQLLFWESYPVIKMTHIEFNDHIMEYEARLVLLANQNWYELLVTHSLLDPITEDVLTGWDWDITDIMVIPYMLMKQSVYTNQEIMKK